MCTSIYGYTNHSTNSLRNLDIVLNGRLCQLLLITRYQHYMLMYVEYDESVANMA